MWKSVLIGEWNKRRKTTALLIGRPDTEYEWTGVDSKSQSIFCQQIASLRAKY